MGHSLNLFQCKYYPELLQQKEVKLNGPQNNSAPSLLLQRLLLGSFPVS